MITNIYHNLICNWEKPFSTGQLQFIHFSSDYYTFLNAEAVSFFSTYVNNARVTISSTSKL